MAFGQRNALVVWQRIVFPDGSSIRIDNAPATDPSGYAGLSDKVDFHTWSLLKGVILSTMLGVGAELQFSGETDLGRYASLYRETYGQEEAIVDLVPQMIAAFLDSDRAFTRNRSPKG